jgi:energy-coupling factor transport system permease protein
MFVFQPKDIFLQSLQPLTIFVYLCVIVGGAVIITHPLVLLAFMLPLCLALFRAEGLDIWIRSLKVFMMMILMLALINTLVNKMGTTVLWAGPILPFFGQVVVSLETTVFALVMGMRLLIVFSAFILYNLIMNPDRALFLFARIFPRSALLVALTAKTIPSLGQQLQRVGEIQQCRGVNYYTGNYLTRFKNRLPLIKVLLLSSLEDSFNVGENIQGRAYGSGPRTNYFQAPLLPRDIIVLLSSLGVVVCSAWSFFAGGGSFRFYPRLGELFSSSEQPVVIAVIFLLLMIPVILAWGWEKWDYFRWKI